MTPTHPTPDDTQPLTQDSISPADHCDGRIPDNATTGHHLLYTPAEAAEKLTTTESWLRRKAGLRLIPCTFIGKRLRFSDADLRAIVASGSRPANTYRPRRTPPRRRNRSY